MPGAALALLAGAALGLGLPPPGALQHNFRSEKHVKVTAHHPSSPPEVPAADAGGAVVHASQAPPTGTEVSKEEETLKSLVDVLEQVMRNEPSRGTAAPRPADTPPLHDAVDAPQLKAYGKHAKKQNSLENISTTRKPPPSTTPSDLALQTDPDISVLCAHESTPLTAALEELALIIQTAATKKKNKALDQLINGFSKILEECLKKRRVKYHN